MKYILVSGGVISGVGKGIVTSSVGTLMKSLGLRVTAIKIDPYLNIDAGTFSPYEHGETFVLDDGGEVDLDLGNYERFLDIKMQSANNVTTGKIYQSVIAKERKGDYLGKTVQVVPHITGEIQDWVERQAKVCTDGSGEEPDICVVELGGTIGDIESMPFVEAFRQFQFRVGRENFCNIHVSLVVETAGNEQKSKPTQNSVRELRGLGITPDIVVCRCKTEMDLSLKDKIALFCNVDKSNVLHVHDCKTIYDVPLLLREQKIHEIISKRLEISPKPPTEASRGLISKWRKVARRSCNGKRKVSIAMIGKYVKLSDAYASVIKALKHAAIAANVSLTIHPVEAEHLEQHNDETVGHTMGHSKQYHEAWAKLCASNGILVPGGFGVRGVEGKVAACKFARLEKKPLLGICLGFQSMVIEYSRNILGHSDANSTEFNAETSYPVVIDMPEHNTGDLGGTMRLGLRKTVFSETSKKSIVKQLYAKCNGVHVDDLKFVEERHRHRYEVNPACIKEVENKGDLIFTGRDIDGERMEIVELIDHPYYVGLQAHPEFLTRPLKPSPAYLGLILASIGEKNLGLFLNDGSCEVSDDDDLSYESVSISGDN